ncbi:MAG: H-NS histone family protein [Gammaproteobacteria bacterium]
MAKVNLEKLSVAELRELAKDVERELAKRQRVEVKKTLSQMKELAAGIGMSVEEVIRHSGSKGQAKYQNPAQPEQTWTGRGKRPGWMAQLLQQGKELEDLEIKSDG